MSTALCPVHQQPWKVVPAGISSKTGQPYNSFVACPVKGCRQRPESPAQPTVLPLNPAATPAPRQTSKDARYAHCLTFAGRLFQGQGTEAVSEAMELAKHMLESWPE